MFDTRLNARAHSNKTVHIDESKEVKMLCLTEIVLDRITIKFVPELASLALAPSSIMRRLIKFLALRADVGDDKGDDSMTDLMRAITAINKTFIPSLGDHV